MAKDNTDKGNYSGFERFLFFLTPILFTAALLGMLLLLFNTEWRNKALEIGNRIPVLKAVLPHPSSSAKPSGGSDAEITVGNAKAKVDELKTLLADKETTLKQATQLTTEQKKQIDDLKAKVDQLNKEKQQRTITNDEYSAKIKSLAAVYAKMTPSKAAPILESMTIDETALIVGAMADTERGRLLEKMTPKTAAEVSLKLKDSVTVDNREIAALQARIKELESKTGASGPSLDSAQLKKTFSAMKPANAATLILTLAVANQTKALTILGALDDNARSQVLAAMSDQNSKTTASLVSKLMPAKP